MMSQISLVKIVISFNEIGEIVHFVVVDLPTALFDKLAATKVLTTTYRKVFGCQCGETFEFVLYRIKETGVAPLAAAKSSAKGQKVKILVSTSQAGEILDNNVSHLLVDAEKQLTPLREISGYSTVFNCRNCSNVYIIAMQQFTVGLVRLESLGPSPSVVSEPPCVAEPPKEDEGSEGTFSLDQLPVVTEPSDVHDLQTPETESKLSTPRAKSKSGGPRKPEFKCDDCELTFRLKGALSLHLKRGHLKCGVCAKAFGHKKNLEKHQLEHKETAFQCSQCPNSYRQKVCRLRHVRESHPKMRTAKRQLSFTLTDLECTVCSFRARNSTALSHHMRKHGNFAKNECHLCHEMVWGDFEDHIYAHYEELTSDYPIKKRK